MHCQIKITGTHTCSVSYKLSAYCNNLLVHTNKQAISLRPCECTGCHMLQPEAINMHLCDLSQLKKFNQNELSSRDIRYCI